MAVDSDDALGQLDNDGDRPSSTPPNYHETGIMEATAPGNTPLCAHCTRFDGGHTCLGWTYPVSRTGVCDAFDDLSARLGIQVSTPLQEGSVSILEDRLVEAVRQRLDAHNPTEFTRARAREVVIRRQLAERKALDEAAATITQAQRDAWVKAGVARPDGSFPIPNAEYLDKAISSYGRGGTGKGPDPADKAWIIARAKALKLVSKLPPDWGVSA
jgi:hypothetical protein